MNPFFVYLIQSSLSLLLLYSMFRLIMRNNRTHALNRFLLLTILLVSAIIPFPNVPFFYDETPIKQVEFLREFVATPVFIESIPLETVQPDIVSGSVPINWWMLMYIVLSTLLIVKISIGVYKVTQIIKLAEKRRLHKIVLAVVKGTIQPFTFINKIVLSEKDFTENKNIIVAHEHAHIKYLHAIDLVVCEVFTVMHLFNPFMWLLRRDLKLIHEYQADQAVLNKGIDAKKYQLLVLQKSVGERRFAMANQFTQKPILKRLKMMQTKNRKQWAALKLILFVPMLIVLLQAFARPESLVEKASSIVPFLVQQDSSTVWLDNWTIENLRNINGGIITKQHIIQPPPGYPGYELTGYDRYEKNNGGVPIPMANVFLISINSKNTILASEKVAESNDVIVGVKNFLLGKHPFNNAKPGPKIVEQNLPIVGTVRTSEGVIVVQHDQNSDKTLVNKLLRQIGEVHLKLREQIAQEKFQSEYFSLSTNQKDVINKMVPLRVSIQEPKILKAPQSSSAKVSDNKPPPPPPPFMIELYKNEIKLSGKSVSKSELNDKAINFLKKVGNDYRVLIELNENVEDKRIQEIKEVLFFAGMNPEKMKFTSME